jgi:NAD(P)-dependent dehydrogenase (short-subunit alcohol dehydrogenase family)
VTTLSLDVTDPAQIQAAVAQVESLDILVNNAGLGLYDDLTDRAVLEQHLAVNLYGTYGVTQAFLPLLGDSRGAVVNVLSIAAVASLPVMSAYSISKAAPDSVAGAIFDGVESGEDEIFPDPMSQSLAASWRGGAAKSLERANAALVAAAAVTS